jgi:L-histidine Nalpha-methyltransferase
MTFAIDGDMSTRVEQGVRLLDLSPARGDVVRDALRGLLATPKTLPSKLLYDAAGSALFERITELDAYYPTRTELAILETSLPTIAAHVGARAWVIELGSGSGLKTRRLLSALREPSALTLVEISRSALVDSARALKAAFPRLEVTGVIGDYTDRLALPPTERRHERKVAFFPGSTLGNFSRREADEFLARVASLVGGGGGLLLGLDRVKDPRVLERAYDDPEGVTARFNLNLLARLNVHGADFDLGAFRHQARYVHEERRIEMHLVSTRRQAARLGDHRIHFDEGESICTEHCHKYDDADIERMARAAGLRVAEVFSDPRSYFSVVWLEGRG